MKYSVSVQPKYVEFYHVRLGRVLPSLEVEAEDRWDAVVKASKKWKIEGKWKMQELFNTLSVKKAQIKSVREWRAIGSQEESPKESR